MSHGWALTLDTTSISLDLTLCDSPEERTEEAINAFFDSIDGVVVVPPSVADEVIRLAEKGRREDEKCMLDIKAGMPVKEAFAKNRTK